MIFVADSEKEVRRYGKSLDGPYAKCIGHILKKLRKANKLGVCKETRSQPDGDITLEYCLDKLVIAGTSNEVSEQLCELRRKTGDFGTLLYVGVDWQNRDLALRSMELLATDVVKMVNSN
jgi:alkanesulfonate monooxygenase SsuD/methylene tetrahydromethanopterin reductase-like flavin-dependent oxidoreductase (luciferase family)